MNENSLAEKTIIKNILDDVFAGVFLLPSCRAMAEPVANLALSPSSHAGALHQALLADPVIACKIMRDVNLKELSKEPITNCEQAINHLGRNITIAKLVHFASHEVIKIKSIFLQQHMQAVLEKSQKISGLCSVLAQISERLNPNTAALTGLLSNIGEIAILNYAQNIPELHNEAALNKLVAENAAEISASIMESWHIPHSLFTATVDIHSVEESDASYADLIFVAEIHADIERHHNSNEILCSADNSPALCRLGLSKISPQVSLKIIKAGQLAMRQNPFNTISQSKLVA